MRKKTRIDLAVSWPKAHNHLPRRLLTRLDPYLIDRELSNWTKARFVFDDEEPILGELLAHAQSKTVSTPGSGGILGLFGKGGPRLPLLRLVQHWTEYDFADLRNEPALQLLITKRIDLLPPLSQYYRAQIELGPECSQCGRVLMYQQANLRVRGTEQIESTYGGDVWQANDVIAETINYEVVISDRLRQLWPLTAREGNHPFVLIEAVGSAERLWQVLPQGTVQVSVPPTPLQIRQRCTACGRPATVAVSTATGVLAGPVQETVYDEEPMLSVIHSSLSEGDFWATDLQHGNIRLESDLFESFSDDPEPFYVKLAIPFWLISQRLYRLLHDINPKGWRCKPVNWI